LKALDGVASVVVCTRYLGTTLVEDLGVISAFGTLRLLSYVRTIVMLRNSVCLSHLGLCLA